MKLAWILGDRSPIQQSTRSAPCIRRPSKTHPLVSWMQKMPAPFRFIPPMECLEVDRIPEGELWQYELKLDGYRTIAIKQDGDVQLFSRNGNFFNSKFPSILGRAGRIKAAEQVATTTPTPIPSATATPTATPRATPSGLCFRRGYRAANSLHS